MAEFLTMSEAEDKFGSKGKTNAADANYASNAATKAGVCTSLGRN